MATEVLRPQDVMVERFRVHTTSYAHRRNFQAKALPTSMASNQNQQRRPSTKHEKKRSDAAAAPGAKKLNHGGGRRRRSEVGSGALALGQVTLLRRGESLDSLATKIGDANPRDPIAEDPAAVRARSDSELSLPKKVRKAAPLPKVDIYAGAAFESSPSPRCLPRPTFCNMKGSSNEPFEDDATRSLRRMLRLE